MNRLQSEPGNLVLLKSVALKKSNNIKTKRLTWNKSIRPGDEFFDEDSDGKTDNNSMVSSWDYDTNLNGYNHVKNTQSAPISKVIKKPQNALKFNKNAFVMLRLRVYIFLYI